MLTIYKIVLVEDDLSIANIVKMTLELRQYEVFHAADGAKALELFGSESFDLALLDIMLPYFDGYELLERLKKRNIPAIFISAKADVADRVKGLQLGAEDYIIKPFETIELLARVDTAIRRIKKHSNTLTAKDVTVNLEKHTVTKAGKLIDLAPLEYELLEKLMENPGLLFSRNQLLDIVWGYDYAGSTRTVDTHIQRLRSKLGFGNLIKTVHKIGYKFEDDANE